MTPDGVSKQMMVFNNTFPGPLIEANWGDTIVIHVKNNLQNNGYFPVIHKLTVVHRYTGTGS
jgi:FtsP/CotA-like multicopper oxidase with cupredoxin domain